MLYDAEKLLLIAGPCSLENLELCREVATELKAIAADYPALNPVFKGSFDKANRTSIHGPRGTGLDKGLEILAAIKEEFGLPVLTDVHESSQIQPVSEVCDVIQIPAFLCRQTDLLLAAAATNCVVNVKKGQFCAPPDMEHVTGKLVDGGATEIWQTERGTTFGYRNLVVDMRGFEIMKSFGHPVVFDATHSVQIPSGAGGKSGGQREFVLPLAKAALAAGADGLFMETHPNPDNALSDGPNMVPLSDLRHYLSTLIHLWSALRRAEG